MSSSGSGMDKDFHSLMMSIQLVLFHICVGTEFADFTSMVLPVERGLKCVFTYSKSLAGLR